MATTYYFENDPARWNQSVLDAPDGHLMQSWEWGDYKARLGWKPYRLMLSIDGKTTSAAQILFRSIPMTVWSIGYIPKGPMIPLEDTQAWECMISGLREIAVNEKAVVIRAEPSFSNTLGRRSQLEQTGFHQTVQSNQPRCTILVNLPAEESLLFSQFGRNHRRLIHKAEKSGVKILNTGAEGIDPFYRQLTETARRKNLPEQDIHFYREAFNTFKEIDQAVLLLAEHNGTIVSSLMVFFFKNLSMHLWAGNSNAGLHCNASFLLHYEAMKLAIQRGCSRCDLWGIPDEIADMLENGESISCKPCDGLWGVYRFKQGFGGAIECFVGTYDYIFKSGIYRLMNRFMTGQKTVDQISAWLHRF